MVSSSSTCKKVCVVGAGVSGLACARELLQEGHDVTVVEQSGGVGGQWLYDPATDAGDPLGVAGVHSSVYASLRLNLPREAAGFSGFPFYPKDGGDARRYTGHGEYLRYIRDFCDAFGLMDVIRLNTRVVHAAVAPRDDDDGGGVMRWVVRCRRLGEGKGGDDVVSEEVFDAVVVASGHYSQPRLPAIKGMDRWSRRQLHSHSYRVPDSFHDQAVVIVGCHESGKEIALELVNVATEVHISVKNVDGVSHGVSMALLKHHNLHLHPQIDRLCEDGQVLFADGSSVVADAIVYCTGYEYSFPFLDTGGLLTVDDNRAAPLFEHTFPPALAPSLSFVGIPKKVLVPRFYEVQARWVAQVLSGRRALPAPDEMLRRAEEYVRAKEMAGVPKRDTHDIHDLDYSDDFGEKHCGFPRLEEWKKELIWSSITRVVQDLETFRDDYRDSELVLQGLRSQGWLTGRPRQVEGDGDGDGDNGVTEPDTHALPQV